jgi:hypothetical protein
MMAETLGGIFCMWLEYLDLLEMVCGGHVMEPGMM